MVLDRFEPIHLNRIDWYQDKALRGRVNTDTARALDRVHGGY